MDKSLQLLQNNIKGRAIVFVISDFDNISENMQKSLSMLAKKTNLACVNVLDVLEQNPPVAGEYMVELEGKQLIFSSGTRKFRKDYQAYFAKQRNDFKDFCRKFSCKYVEVRTDIAPYNQLRGV